MNRMLTETKCKICNEVHKTIGFQSHLKHKHGITPIDYIEKYGEYRKKYLEYQERAESNDGVTCLICNDNFASERHLSFHIKKNHNITKHEYIVKYILHNEIPKCKCGCGEAVTIKSRGRPPYWCEYKSGHNAHMHVGTFRSDESKKRMRKAAIKRMEQNNSVFHKGISDSEKELGRFIQENYGGNIIFNDTNILSGLELDIVIPELKLAIELNGDRFHSDLYKDKKYHIKKTQECEKLDYRLVHIWYCDWYSKTDIVKSILLNLLNKTKTRIYARNCGIREISNQQCNEFLNKNHLQGASVSSKRYGLFHNDELVQVMSFSKLRKAVGKTHQEGSYELVRFANKINTQVIGGGSKLLKYFVSNERPKHILSFANRDWSNGNFYEKMGMVFVKNTSPGYFYVKGKQRFHRYKFQKHKLVEMGYDTHKTEYEIMTELGYYRIWDSGNILYELKFG